MTPAWLRLRWLFNRRVARALLWSVLLLAAAVAANVAGYFLAWRLCLYGATAYGWLWMRRRLLAREAGVEARRRLIRAEIAGAAAIVALEVSLLAQAA